MDFFLAILPNAILIWVMAKKRPWPSHLALPFAASLVYFIVLAYFHNDPNLVNATVVNGALSAFTPISIIWDAIPLSQTMRRSGAEHIVSQWFNSVSPNLVAQLMIVGWPFAFMIEGSGGSSFLPEITNHH